MKVHFHEPATIASIQAVHSRTLEENIRHHQHTRTNVQICGWMQGPGVYRMWAIPTSDTTAEELGNVTRRAAKPHTPTIETIHGLVVEAIGFREKAQALAEMIRGRSDTEAVYLEGMLTWLAVVPKKGTSLNQLKQGIESLASRIT